MESQSRPTTLNLNREDRTNLRGGPGVGLGLELDDSEYKLKNYITRKIYYRNNKINIIETLRNGNRRTSKQERNESLL